MSFINFLKNAFRPGERLLGDCPFLTSFLKLSAELDSSVVDYICAAIQNGIAGKYHRGAAWSIARTPEMPPCPRGPRVQGSLAEYPVFHAITNEGIPLLAAFDMTGGFWLRCQSALGELADVELIELVPLPVGSDHQSIFYWGLCPDDPKAAERRHKDICVALSANLDKDDYFEMNEVLYHSAEPENMFALRIACIEKLGFAVAMRQYFLGEVPEESDPVLLCDPEHTVVEQMLPLFEFQDWIKDTIRQVDEKNSKH
ncbi:MAG TPA: hypothetical protein VKX17_26150 [Planctomycetota bacterium]|nr:hypothetical protein [Planctomycetota bacterium]